MSGRPTNVIAETLRAMRAVPEMSPAERAAREARRCPRAEQILCDLENAAHGVLKRLRSLQSGTAAANALTEARLAVDGMRNLFTELRLAQDNSADTTSRPAQDALAPASKD